MQLIYNCLVQPYFDYCSAVWDSCIRYLANKLQKLQNRAARVLTSSSYDTNADALRDTSNNLKNSFSYSGAVLWNTLPTELVQASTLHKFKSDCSNFIE